MEWEWGGIIDEAGREWIIGDERLDDGLSDGLRNGKTEITEADAVTVAAHPADTVLKGNTYKLNPNRILGWTNRPDQGSKGRLKT